MTVHGVGALKRHAIDAYMKDLSSTLSYGYDYHFRAKPQASMTDMSLSRCTETEYEVNVTVHNLTAYREDFKLYISRPDEQGQGGGVLLSSTRPSNVPVFDPGFAQVFDGIRLDIDDLLAPFTSRELPNPMVFHDMMHDTLGPATKALSTSNNADTIKGLSDISGEIKLLTGGITDLNGRFIHEFKARFLENIEDVIVAYYCTACTLGAALAGEQGLWEKTASVVDEAVARASNALQEYSDKSGMSWKEIANVLGVVEAGVGLFASTASLFIAPTVALGASGLVAGLSFVTKTGNFIEDTKPTQSFASLMKAFAQDLQNITTNIHDEEKLLHDNLSAWMLGATQPEWNLDNQFAGTAIDQRHSWDGVNLELPKFQDMYQSTLPHISSDLRAVKQKIELLTDNSMWYRDPRLGVSYRGCWSQWDQLRWELTRLLGDLQTETDRAAKVLQDADSAFRHNDESAAAKLKKLRRTIDAGTGYSADDPNPDRFLNDHWLNHV